MFDGAACVFVTNNLLVYTTDRVNIESCLLRKLQYSTTANNELLEIYLVLAAV
jgi:hypothetical protein